MRFDKDTSDFRFNMEAFNEMDLFIPMTRHERNALRHLAHGGLGVGCSGGQKEQGHCDKD